MNYLIKKSKLALTVMLTLVAALNGCSNSERFTEKNFVGKWKSSKVTTPIYLYENGEWELMKKDGTVQQYGVWQYTKNRIMWSYKAGNQMEHDMNAILSATPDEFQLRESDNSITTFNRID